MLRPFSRFPDGAPGLGLLLLRTTVGSTAIVSAIVHLNDHAVTATLASWSVDGVVIVTGTAVLVGLYAPGTAATLALALAVFRLVAPAQPLPFLDQPGTLLTIANAAALSLLGPGAFSVDARLFGHREIVIPRDILPPRG